MRIEKETPEPSIEKKAPEPTIKEAAPVSKGGEPPEGGMGDGEEDEREKKEDDGWSWWTWALLAFGGMVVLGGLCESLGL